MLISVLSPGVLSKEEVRYMWDELPQLLKAYVYQYIHDDATILGYHDGKLSTSLPSIGNVFPNHYEKRTDCRPGEH